MTHICDSVCLFFFLGDCACTNNIGVHITFCIICLDIIYNDNCFYVVYSAVRYHVLMYRATAPYMVCEARGSASFWLSIVCVCTRTS